MKILKNYHVLKITYLGATNTRGSRVKITSERFKQSKYLAYDYSIGRTLNIAQYYLEKKGFEIIGQAEGNDCDYIITSTFEPLK